MMFDWWKKGSKIDKTFSIIIISIVVAAGLFVLHGVLTYNPDWVSEEYFGVLQAVKYEQGLFAITKTSLMFSDREFELDDYQVGFKIGSIYKIAYRYDRNNAVKKYVLSVELME